MLLALDLGTKTGWATFDGKNRFSGMQHFKNDRFSGGGMRYLKFRKWLDTLPPVSHVVYEEVRRHAATDAAHVYGGLMAVITSWCEERALPYAGVPVGTIKKHWCGKGNANKLAMIHEAKKRGYEAEDDNEVDALALLDYWIEEGTFVLD